MKHASMTMIATIILLLLTTLLQFQMILITREIRTNHLIDQDYQHRTQVYLRDRN